MSKLSYVLGKFRNQDSAMDQCCKWHEGAGLDLCWANKRQNQLESSRCHLLSISSLRTRLCISLQVLLHLQVSMYIESEKLMNYREEGRCEGEREGPWRMKMRRLESRYWGTKRVLGSIVRNPMCIGFSMILPLGDITTLISPPSDLITCLDSFIMNPPLSLPPPPCSSSPSYPIDLIIITPWKNTITSKNVKILLFFSIFLLSICLSDGSEMFYYVCNKNACEYV